MNQWKSVAEAPPPDVVLVYVDGSYHVAVLHSDASGDAWMDVHTDALLPEPSHWMELEPPAHA